MADKSEKKIDPYDVAALEKSLNDSATRVSTIWVSFLIFSLYLLTAATTVTHRQLFLAEPVKLPVLNIDLPLWGFFFLAPILFVIFHAYVLLQVLLLGRTAAAYDQAVKNAVKRHRLSSEAESSLRQRLANTLFAQIFAGSPRERGGWLGQLLKGMAWITLAVAPILILLVFQFMFLPYHSHIATWAHRFLLLLELATFFLIWPLALDAGRELEWTKIWPEFKRTAALPVRLISLEGSGRNEWLWIREHAVPIAACLLFAVLSLGLASFPGEPHVNLFTGTSLDDVQCDRWFHQGFPRADLRVDRLVLPQVDVVDDEKFTKIVQTTSDRKLSPNEGERTRNFRERDLNCGIFYSADLRRVDLTEARMAGAGFSNADLQGASLDRARLQDANFVRAQLQGASLKFAQSQGATFDEAGLQGALFGWAQLQGASFGRASLQGASFGEAGLQATSFRGAKAHGTEFTWASLEGTSFRDGELQAATLMRTQLQAANFMRSQLQGVRFDAARMPNSSISKSYLWRATGANCSETRIAEVNFDAIVELDPAATSSDAEVDPRHHIQATHLSVGVFIERAIGDVPGLMKDPLRRKIRDRLSLDVDSAEMRDVASHWKACAENNPPNDEYYESLAQYLTNLVCESEANQRHIANGVFRNWIENTPSSADFIRTLARNFLELGGNSCPGARKLHPRYKDELRNIWKNSSG